MAKRQLRIVPKGHTTSHRSDTCPQCRRRSARDATTASNLTPVPHGRGRGSRALRTLVREWTRRAALHARALWLQCVPTVATVGRRRIDAHPLRCGSAAPARQPCALDCAFVCAWTCLRRNARQVLPNLRVGVRRDHILRRCACAAVSPDPGADVAAASPVLVQMWPRRAEIPAQMWPRRAQIPAQMWPRRAQIPAQMWPRRAKRQVRRDSIFCY